MPDQHSDRPERPTAADCLTTLASAVDKSEVMAVMPFDMSPMSDVIHRGGSAARRLGRIRVVGFGLMATTCSVHPNCTLKLNWASESFRRMECTSFLWLIAGTTMDVAAHQREADVLVRTRNAEVAVDRAARAASKAMAKPKSRAKGAASGRG